MKLLYSEQRERHLRLALRVALGVALVLVAAATWLMLQASFFVDDGADAISILLLSLSLLLPGLCLLAAARTALKWLPGRGVAARLWALTTGGLLLLATLPFLTDLVGLPLLFLGLLIITMAWIRDADTPG